MEEGKEKEEDESEDEDEDEEGGGALKDLSKNNKMKDPCLSSLLSFWRRKEPYVNTISLPPFSLMGSLFPLFNAL